MASVLSRPSSTLLLHPSPPLGPPWAGAAAAAAAVAVVLPLLRRSGRRGALLVAAGKKYKGTAMREEKLAELIAKKVAEAMETCGGEEGAESDGCRVAWDEVEEVSQAKAHLREKLAKGAADPLEPFCSENPETEECKIYED